MTASTPRTRPARSSSSPPRRGGRSPGLRRALSVLVWLVPIGVLVQAAIAGQALFLSPSLFGLHGGLGHGVLGLAVVTTVLTWLVGRSRAAAALSGLAVVALIGQTGLGYVGHRSGVPLASSLHVPLGVAILGLTVAVAVLVTVSGARTGAADPGTGGAQDLG